jgi:signal peptidase II
MCARALLVMIAKKWIVFSSMGVFTLVADQVTKYWARSSLPTDGRGYGLPVPVIDNFWDWRLSYNTGSAFGLFHGVTGAQIVLTIFGVVALLAIAWMVRQAKAEQRAMPWALGLVGGGALGNVIDRLIDGKVTDFVVWKYHQHEWPTFNVADVALCIGVGLLFLELSLEARAEKAAKRAARTAKTTGKK